MLPTDADLPTALQAVMKRLHDDIVEGPADDPIDTHVYHPEELKCKTDFGVTGWSLWFEGWSYEQIKKAFEERERKWKP